MKRRCMLFVAVGIVLSAYAHGSPIDTTTYRLDDVVVTGTRNRTDLRHLPMTLSVIGREALTQDYRQSVLPTLTEQVPGLFVTSRGLLGYGVSTGSAGSIKVRGVGGGASLFVLVDGLPQYAGLYGHPIADAYQTMLAERVEVLRGPASTIYGSNAMGGVMNIVTRQIRENGMASDIHLQGGSYGTLEGNATMRFRSNRFFGIAGANYGRTDGHRANSKFEQTAGFVKIGYDLTPAWTLSGHVNVTYFENSNPGEASNPYIDNDMKITRGMAALSLTNDYGKTSGALRVFYNWGHHHINDGYHPGGTSRTTYYIHDDKMGGLSLYQSASFFTGNRITLGMDFQHFGGEAWNKAMSGDKRTELAHKTVNEVAGYVDFRQDLASWITLDAGIRLDHHSVAGNEWVPQGGFTFRLPHVELRAMVSKGFRHATLRELYMFRPANSALKPERLMNYELSYKQRLLRGRLLLGTNVFYLKADELISTVMVGGKPLNMNTGKTENTGFELEVDYSANRHLRLNGNYSYLHMSRPQIAAPRHKLYAGGRYEAGRFGLNAGLQWIDGLYTAVGNDEQKENFVLLNLTADCRMGKGVRLFVKGENLLAQRYEILAGFPMSRATFMGGIGWVF